MKVAFWSVFAFGFVLCSTVGIGPTLQRVGGDWGAPAMVAGSLIGMALLALAVMFALGVRPAVLSADSAMLAVLAVLMTLKIGIGATQAALSAVRV